MQGAWLSRFPFCTLGWSHLEVTHARGHIARWGKGLKIGNSPSLLKRSCQIHYFAEDKYIFFYLFMFLFQWTNLRRRLCGSLPTCVLLQLQITSIAKTKTPNIHQNPQNENWPILIPFNHFQWQNTGRKQAKITTISGTEWKWPKPKFSMFLARISMKYFCANRF